MEIPQWRERKEIFPGGGRFIFKKWLEMFKCFKVRNVRNGPRENGLMVIEV